jgi:hypothetical protein
MIPQAMTKKLYHGCYYVLATRMAAFPPSWRWRIVRRGKPMGVRIEGGGFTTYEAARLAGSGRWQTSLISLSANVFGLTVEVTSTKAIAA